MTKAFQIYYKRRKYVRDYVHKKEILINVKAMFLLSNYVHKKEIKCQKHSKYIARIEHWETLEGFKKSYVHKKEILVNVKAMFRLSNYVSLFHHHIHL